MIISTDAEESIWQNLTPIHDKNPQPVGNRGELPQLDREHLPKNLQLTYLMVKDQILFPLRLRIKQGCPLLPNLFSQQVNNTGSHHYDKAISQPPTPQTKKSLQSRKKKIKPSLLVGDMVF